MNHRQPARPMCATLHAWYLHDDRVWQLVQVALDRSSRRGARWTVFVAPRFATVDGADLTRQLDWLAERNHEIAMCSFAHVENDIDRSMSVDRHYLEERGHSPRGFVAGAWLLHDAIFTWLRSNRFSYDCSLRTYARAGSEASLVRNEPARAVSRIGRMVELPTTATLRMQAVDGALGRRHGLAVGAERYDLFYLHDYDLLDRHRRAALRAVEALAREREFVAVSDLVDRIEPSISLGDAP